MYAIRLFVFLGLVISAVVSEAQVFQASPSSKRTVLIYEEDGITTVDQLGRATDGWPEIIHRNQFHEPARAKEFLRQNFPGRIAGTFTDGEALKSSGTPLWKVTAQWSWAFEVELANWIRTDVDKDFFVRHGIATDCADVAYALRWIFARAHGLPMTSRLASGDWMNQDSMRPAWLKLPTANEWYNDKRFLAALDYLLDFTFTHTLLGDSYPTAIQMGSLIEGGYHLTTHGNTGHTRPFTRVIRPGETGLPILVLQSTTPRKVQPLFGDGYWATEVPVKGESGLLRFRWPDGTGKGLISSDQMPQFSEDQYDPAFLEMNEVFYVAVFRHLDPSFTLDKIAAELFKSVQKTVLFRDQLVNEGYAFCSANDCSEGSAGFEAWSTPSRDSRLGEMFLQLLFFKEMVPEEELRKQMEKDFLAPLLTLEGVDYNLKSIFWAWNKRTFSVDPRVPAAERWGLSARANISLLQKESTHLWNTREASLAKTSNCPANICVPYSAAWKERSSQEMDSRLADLLSLSTTYCGNAPPAECAEFKRQLALPFGLRAPGMSLQQTLESFLSLNSDPRHSVQVRREGIGVLPFYVGQFGSIGSNANFLLAKTDARTRIWDLRNSRVEVMPPSGAVWTAPNLEINRAWFTENQDVGFRDLLSGVEKRVSLSFKPTGRISSLSGSAFFWNSTTFAFVNADGILVREGNHEKVRARDSNNLFVTVGSTVFLYTLEAADYKSFPTSISSFAEYYYSVTKLGWFYNDSSLHLLKRDGSTVDFSNIQYALLTEDDGQTFYAVSNPDGLLKVQIDKNGAIISTEKIGDYTVLYSSSPYLKIKTGVHTDYIFLVDGKFKSARLLPGESEVTAIQDDLVLGKNGDGSFVRRLGGSSPFYKANARLSFIPGKKGLVRLCSPEGGTEQLTCQIEDVFKPASFSLFTGIPLYESDMQGMILFQYQEVLPLERGMKVSIGSNITWVDL